MNGSGACGNICRAASEIAAVRERLEHDADARVGADDLALTFLALLIEATFGYPDRLLRQSATRSPGSAG